MQIMNIWNERAGIFIIHEDFFKKGWGNIVNKYTNKYDSWG